jgi:hypothetical protein
MALSRHDHGCDSASPSSAAKPRSATSKSPIASPPWSSAPRCDTIRRANHLRHVELTEPAWRRSDFSQQPGTPLQWLEAWETVAAREQAERAKLERLRSERGPCPCRSE